LHETEGLIQAARPAVGAEGKLADADLAAFAARALLRPADGGDLGRGVDDSGHGLIVHMAEPAGGIFSGRDPLLHRLVRQPLPTDHVADRVDFPHAGVVASVYLDPAARIQPDADLRRADPLGGGPPPDGDETPVALDHLAPLERDSHAGAVPPDLRHPHAGAD